MFVTKQSNAVTSNGIKIQEVKKINEYILMKEKT